MSWNPGAMESGVQWGGPLREKIIAKDNYSLIYFTVLIFKKLSRLIQGKAKGNKGREWQRMKWLDSITDAMDMNLSKLGEVVEDGGAWCAAVHGVTKSWA